MLLQLNCDEHGKARGERRGGALWWARQGQGRAERWSAVVGTGVRRTVWCILEGQWARALADGEALDLGWCNQR